jgi:uncharacterized protein
MQTHAIAWFEIPVTDFERARAFYSAIFAFEMPDMTMGPNRMGFLLHEQGRGVGGAIVQGPGCVPSAQGTLAYLDAGGDLATVLGRVAAAGGAIDVPKTAIAPGMGFYAVFRDTEGNRVGLHSMD